MGETVLPVLPDVHGGVRVLFERLQTFQNVAKLGLKHVQNRVVGQVGVGPIEHEHVGKATDGDAFERHSAVLPGLVQGLSAPACYPDG